MGDKLLEQKRLKRHSNNIAKLKAYADPKTNYESKVNYIETRIEKD